MKMLLRFICIVPMLVFAAAPTAALAAETPSSRGASHATRAVELTFLKSLPGERDNLRQFIEKNWFAIDAFAQKQGLMAAYTVLDSGSDEGAWNLLVAVTYHTPQGYEGILDAFERIRSAHKTVLIEGKSLKDLGRIVDSKKLQERLPGA
jgi:hypothetical protein